MKRKRIALTDRNGKAILDAEGRQKTWNLKTAELDESRIPCFVVPPGLAETQVSILDEVISKHRCCMLIISFLPLLFHS